MDTRLSSLCSLTVALAACTGTMGGSHDAAPVSADLFCTQVAATVCDADATCFPASHPTDCKTTQEAACAERVQPLVDDPRLGYDPLSAGAFVSSLAESMRSCGDTPIDYDAFTAIFTGTGAAGADCTPRDLTAASLRTSALSCAGGNACHLYLRADGSTEGVCEARTEGACSHAFDCGAGEFCDLPDHWTPGVWGSCRPLRVDGWACGGDLECASRYCAGTCQKLPADRRPLVASYADVVLAQTPVAFYRFTEAGGTRAGDASGDGHDATLTGMVTRDPHGAVAHETNGAIRLAGGYARIPAITGLTGDALTLEAWFKPDATTANQPILELSDGTHVGPHVWQFDSGDKVYTNLVDENGDAHSIMSDAGVVTSDGWHHVVATYDGTTGTLYLDGHRIGTTDMTSALRVDGDLYVGHRLAMGMGDAVSYTGLIDEVAVYDHALSASAITRHHTTGDNGKAVNELRLFTWLR